MLVPSINWDSATQDTEGDGACDDSFFNPFKFGITGDGDEQIKSLVKDFGFALDRQPVTVINFEVYAWVNL